MKDLMAAANALAAASGPMQQLTEYFGSLDQALTQADKIHGKVVERMEPSIRQALAAGYSPSGLASNGPLHEAAVTGARIETAEAFSGIFISLKSGMPERVYKTAGAWEYGATRGLGGGKSAIKSAAKKGKIRGEGISTIAARPFFDISSLNAEALYGALFQDEVNKLMEKVK